MERCAYCGAPVRDGGVQIDDDVFCSVECSEEFDTDDSGDDLTSDYDDSYSERDYRDYY